MIPTLQCGRFELKLERPLIMGIVNVTPDSFSDGKADFSPESAIDHARTLFEQGADILDIGGESTRPGAQPVSEADELKRILPVIKALHGMKVPLSVDTMKPGVMQAALKAGADMINDINAFRAPGAIDAVKHSRCGLCVMHMQGEPRTMQADPYYQNVVQEVHDYLQARAHALLQAGIQAQRIVLDPGFGFGKTLRQNYRLLANWYKTLGQNYVSLLGLSRKSMIGQLTGRPPQERLAGSLAAMLAGVAQGAHIVRVHDVAQTADALRVWQAVQNEVINDKT